MKRRIFTILSALSLVLCVVTVLLWVRSYSGPNTVDDFMLPLRMIPMYPLAGVFSYRGEISVYAHNSLTVSNTDTSTRSWNCLGLSFVEYQKLLPGATTPLIRYRIEISHWSLTLLFAIIPSIWIFYGRWRSPYGLGHCLKCGYDLRASKDHCPECGTAIEASIKAPAAP